MELNYNRCPGDDADMLSTEIELEDGKETVAIGVAEIASVLQMKGTIYGVTMAIKSGVTDDFNLRCAAALSNQMGEDVHALCPVISMLISCRALMGGAGLVRGPDDQLHILLPKHCPRWVQAYFVGGDLDKAR